LLKAKAESEDKANVCLSKWWVVLVFIMGLSGIVPCFIFSDIYRTRGYTKKGEQVWRYFWIGLGLQILTIILVAKFY
jgi:hypothetical protein